MKRPLHIWIAFGLAVAVLLGGMGWVSLTALRLDRAEAEARREAKREQNVRLALWRIESSLAPLIAQENYRPYFTYSAFYPAERAYTRLFRPVDPGEVLVPSPLLNQVSPYILLHFQFGPDGEPTSPQVPTGNMRDLAEVAYTTHEDIVSAAARLEKLASLVTRARLLAALPRPQPVADQPGAQRGERPEAGEAAGLESEGGNDVSGTHEGPAPQVESRTSLEWQARLDRTRPDNAMVLPPQAQQAQLGSPQHSRKVTKGLLHPVWVGDALLLARGVSVNGEEYLQGCWLDWPAMRRWLLDGVEDLLPKARLEPVRVEANVRPERTLAALPARLVPGDLAAPPPHGLSTVEFTLLVGWACILVAGIAVAWMLTAVIALSERRGTFVSAVTHEMRTPLTTFQMYAEMLAEGMVTDEKRRQRYLNTLRAEAQRLGHLVENVLAYARLERVARPSRMDIVTLSGLVDSLRERFADRARRAGMEFRVEAGDDELRVRADTSAVERILFNLVDNACKYASGAEDKRIHLVVDRDGKFARLRVWDHGPGISAQQHQRLFHPFSKSAYEAAHSAPGIGLGLALSRRLARRMGGDLEFDDTVRTGACFSLTVPIA